MEERRQRALGDLHEAGRTEFAAHQLVGAFSIEMPTDGQPQAQNG
jgi:hypothetical protein